jgi:hypothetical protein
MAWRHVSVMLESRKRHVYGYLGLGLLIWVKKWHGVMLASCKRHVSVMFMVTLGLGYLFGFKKSYGVGVLFGIGVLFGLKMAWRHVSVMLASR